MVIWREGIWISIFWFVNFICFFSIYFDEKNEKQGKLNDMWVFNNSVWIWIDGSNTVNPPSIPNYPNARYGAMGWIDSNDNLWLFGGNDMLSGTTSNDLWMFGQ